MATKKGKELAGILAEFLGYTPAITETCSLIARHAATLDRLAVEECNGPAWVDSPHATPERLDKWGLEIAAKWDRTAARVTALVDSFPATDHGPIRAILGGDPRGYVVLLVVPRGDRYPLGVGLTADSVDRGVHVRDGVTA